MVAVILLFFYFFCNFILHVYANRDGPWFYPQGRPKTIGPGVVEYLPCKTLCCGVKRVQWNLYKKKHAIACHEYVATLFWHEMCGPAMKCVVQLIILARLHSMRMQRGVRVVCSWQSTCCGVFRLLHELETFESFWKSIKSIKRRLVKINYINESEVARRIH
jgi:hypothetical protein